MEEPPAKPYSMAEVEHVRVPPMRAWRSVGDGGRFRWNSILSALGLVVAVTLVCSGVYTWWQRERRSGASAETRPAPLGAAERQSVEKAPPAAQAEPPVAERLSEGAAAPAVPGPVHVQVTATETSWVRARSDGKYAFSATLDPNQTRTVDADESVELLLGNAGGVSVVLNGKPIGALGPKGQVRTVQLSSGGFKIVSAKPPAPAPADPL